jgi:hypothetical protein
MHLSKAPRVRFIFNIYHTLQQKTDETSSIIFDIKMSYPWELYWDTKESSL